MSNRLPDVGRIGGAVVSGGPAPETATIQIQYTDQQGQWHELHMPFLDGMYLLNCLKAIQLQTGFQMPDDPRQTP